MTTEGIEFINTRPEVVLDYLGRTRRQQFEAKPSDLAVKYNGRLLKLAVLKEPGQEYPVRKSFLYKLLNWYHFPLRQLRIYSGDTIASICNDYLINIDREYVNVKLEDGEALTITSPDYNDLQDADIIKKLSALHLKTVSRNDFMMRATTETEYKFQPAAGDEFGAGLSIINSETGFRALNVSHYVLRYICSNGAMIRIGQEGGRKIHYGNQPGELEQFLNAQIEQAKENEELLEEKYKASLEIKAIEAGAVLKKIQASLGKRKVQIDDQLSLFDYYNSVTDLAKQFDLSKRIYLETLAGELIYN